jgi:quercetin dioxygenase-like cupin family protein
MYIVDYHERDVLDVDLKGSKNVTVRWLIGKRSGALNYAMRLFEIAPGGIVPLHDHDEEHEIVVFVPPNEPHGYDNTDGTEVFRFICVIPLLEKE